MGEKNQGQDDWRGWRFVVISLAVTLSCSIFFFAGREIFPNMGVRARAAWGILTQRVIEWGGVRLKTIELQALSDQDQGKLMAPFENLSAQLKDELSIYYGSPFWSLDLSKVKQQILAQGWVKNVYLRRSFPESLKIQIMPKTPVLLVRNSSGWVAVDEEGAPLLISSQVPGAWLSLPMVFGFENIFDRGHTLDELKRQVADKAETLKDAQALVAQLKSKVNIEVESIYAKDEAWTKETLLTVKFSLPNEKVEKSKETKYQITFLSHDWANRLSAFQYVLSDLSAKKSESIRVLGQFEGRWIVEGIAEAPEAVVVKAAPLRSASKKAVAKKLKKTKKVLKKSKTTRRQR